MHEELLMKNYLLHGMCILECLYGRLILIKINKKLKRERNFELIVWLKFIFMVKEKYLTDNFF